MLSKRDLLFAGLTGLVALGGAGKATAYAPGIEGLWQGLMTRGAASVRLQIEVSSDGNAVMTLLDQGTQVAGTAKADADTIRFDFPLAKGHFEGRKSGPDILEGFWTGAQGATALTLRRGGAMPEATATTAPLTPDILRALRRSNGMVGVGAAAHGARGPVQLWADGERRLGSGIRVTVEDKWHLGSVSKSMLATVAGRVVDQGRLSWSDTLGDVLGKAVPDMHEGYRKATLLHLLSHHAGLPDNLPLSDMREFAASQASHAEQQAAFLKKALAGAPSAPVGSTMLYSNVGYVATAAMLTVRTGQPWQELMRAELFLPLDLSSGGFGPPGVGQPVGHGAFMGGPFQPHDPNAPNADLPEVMGPAGSVHMTLRDLATYLRAHCARSSLLKPATWQVLQTPPFSHGYALGWTVNQGGVLSHNGSNQLWYAEVEVDRANDRVAAVVSNDGRPAAQIGVKAALAGALSAAS